MAKTYDYYLAGERHGATEVKRVIDKVPRGVKRIALEGLEQREYTFADVERYGPILAEEERKIESFGNLLVQARKEFSDSLVNRVSPSEIAALDGHLNAVLAENQRRLMTAFALKFESSKPGWRYLSCALDFGVEVVGIEDPAVYSQTSEDALDSIYASYIQTIEGLNLLAPALQARSCNALGVAIEKLNETYANLLRDNDVFEVSKRRNSDLTWTDRSLFERTTSWVDYLEGGPSTFLLCGKMHVFQFIEDVAQYDRTSKIVYLKGKNQVHQRWLDAKREYLASRARVD